jgi:hypothetical protein
MIFDQYIKLFSTDWIEPWMIEAMITIVGALLLVFMIGKAIDCFNGESQ